MGGIVDDIKEPFRAPIPDSERYRMSQSWGGATNMARFLEVSGRAKKVNGPEQLGPGDVLQLFNTANGDYDHTIIVVERRGTDLIYAQHSEPKIDAYQKHLLGAVKPGQVLAPWRMADTFTFRPSLPPPRLSEPPGWVREF